MSVFDKKTKIGRRVKDPGTDKNLLGPGALSFGAMTSPAGLAGCTGIDTALIHGDQWDIIQGNRQVMILQNWTQTTIGNKTCTVVQNRLTTTVANRNDTIVGATVRTNVGAAAHTYIAPHVATHAAPQNRLEPTSYLHFIVDQLWAGNSLKNIGMIYFQFYALYTSITPTYINMTPVLNFALTGF